MDDALLHHELGLDRVAADGLGPGIHAAEGEGVPTRVATGSNASLSATHNDGRNRCRRAPSA